LIRESATAAGPSGTPNLQRALAWCNPRQFRASKVLRTASLLPQAGGCQDGGVNNNPHRRLRDRRDGAPTVIGTGVSFRGDIIAPGAVMMSGNVHGDGDIGGTLAISRGSHWEGHIKARDAIIAGSLTGGIEVTQQLEVGSAAVIKGNVIARTLAIARGAVIEGEIQVTSGAPVVQFEEKRSEEAS
jgi:cytoskeletal protein CcmA (bactofilin family)